MIFGYRLFDIAMFIAAIIGFILPFYLVYLIFF